MKIKWETVCVCHVPHGRSHLHSAVINTELNRNPTPCSHIFLCVFFFTLDSPSPTPCCVFSIFCEAVKGSEVGDGQSASCHGHKKRTDTESVFYYPGQCVWRVFCLTMGGVVQFGVSLFYLDVKEEAKMAMSYEVSNFFHFCHKFFMARLEYLENRLMWNISNDLLIWLSSAGSWLGSIWLEVLTPKYCWQVKGHKRVLLKPDLCPQL